MSRENEIIVASNSTTERWRLWVSERAEAFLLYARQCTRGEEDARDVLQESLAEAWKRSGHEIPDPPLVYATIRRRAIDHGRSVDSRHRREQAFVHQTEQWFQPDFSAADTNQAIANALLQLSKEFRETVTLKLWGELTFPEIAEITGVSTATATSRYRYALSHLREILTPHFT